MIITLAIRSDKYIRLAFNQFRPLASGVSSVDVELKCDCNHTQTITVENEKVQEFNDTTKGNLLNRGFNEAFNPVDSYLKPRPFRAFKHHPFALRDWLSDKHKLNNVLGRVYSYVLWFENPKKNQPIECHFKIASMRSKGKELHTVYTNSFTLVDSTDSNSSKNSKKNDGTGQLAKPTDAHADRSVGVPDILPQQPQPATQPKTQRQKPQREQRRREQREQRARQTETPSTAVCPRDQHPPNNNWVKNLVAVGAITGGLAAAIAFGSSSSSNTHHNHGHGK